MTDETSDAAIDALLKEPAEAGDKDDGAPDENDAILERSRTLYNTDKAHWDKIYNKARDDLKFQSDEAQAQWDDEEYVARTNTGRPVITVDYLSQFVHQVANNIRMNTPRINPIPSGSGASQETAGFFKGLIKQIEYVSCADEVYDTGATSAVRCGIGYMLVDHDFIDDSSFDQGLFLHRVNNPFTIYPDSKSLESDGRDYRHAHILERMTVSDFKKEYPGEEPSSFGDDTERKGDIGDEEEITIAQFYEITHEEQEIAAVSKAGTQLKRKIKKARVQRYKLSGAAVLGKTTFPGCYIPVVPFYGEELWIDGERHLYSLIRKAKTSQQLLNLMKSLEFEVLRKQPIAPVLVAAGAIENYKADWLDPSKSLALRYDTRDADGNELPPPQRLAPPQASEGFTLAGREAVDDMKASMGMYNNALGQQGQEISGKAIDARKIQGDVATFHFGDNAVRAITQCGRILVCAAPEIYDTERIVQILDDEDKPKDVGINGAIVDGQKVSHDLQKGKYDIRVITGSNFVTLRQESAQFYQDWIMKDPELMKLAGDLMFENMDIRGSQQMAARLRKLIDPKLLAPDNDQLTPQEQAMASQNDQLKKVIAMGAQQLQTLQQQLTDKTLPAKLKAQTDQQKIKFDTLVKLMDIAVKDRNADTNEKKIAGELAIADQGQDLTAVLAMMEHIMALTTPDAKQQQTELPGSTGNLAANNGAGNYPTGEQ